MSSKALIIGCGYIGHPLALHLQEQGYEVSAWVRSEDHANQLTECGFAQVIYGSVADGAVWNAVDGHFDLVIHCASSGGGGEAGYDEVFLKGMVMVNMCEPEARRIFVSSTSVYAQTHGRVVTELSLAEPLTETGLILREAEKAALEGGATVVRSAGIYGPGRCALFDKFCKNEAIIEGDGKNWINQIHKYDLLNAIVHLIAAGEAGQIYNAVDDTPVTYNDYYCWCSRYLHKPMPPHGPINPNRKRGLTNKQVSNAKLRASGWEPIYPSFHEGLVADCMTAV